MIIATIFFLALTNNSFASTYTGKCYCKSHFPRWSLCLSYVSLCIALATSILHQTETKKTFERSGKWFIPIPQIVLLLKWVTLAPLLARMPTLILSLLSLYQWWLELLSMLLSIFNYWLTAISGAELTTVVRSLSETHSCWQVEHLMVAHGCRLGNGGHLKVECTWSFARWCFGNNKLTRGEIAFRNYK